MSGTIRRKKPDPPTLLTDSDGSTCPPVPVFRLPFFRTLRSLCYGALILFVFPGCLLFPYTLIGVFLFAVFLMAIWGFLLLSTVHGRIAAAAYRVRHLAGSHRFLCPQCLEFGGFRYGCGACGDEVEPFVVHTGGLYLDDCPHCHAPVYAAGKERGSAPRAYCAGCGSVGTEVHHQRAVRVLATLRGAELDRLQATAPGTPESTGELEYLRLDDGEYFTYVLALGEELSGEGQFTSGHAARQVEALWLGGDWPEPLALAEALDRFIRRVGLSEARRRTFPVCVSATMLDLVVREQLVTRFPAAVFGITAETFLNTWAAPVGKIISVTGLVQAPAGDKLCGGRTNETENGKSNPELGGTQDGNEKQNL